MALMKEKITTRAIQAMALALVLVGLTDTFAEPDLWGYLCFGRLFWQNPGFPYHDVFSYVPTNSTWVFHEWLTGALFFRIYEWMGSGGLQILKYLLGIGAAFLVYETSRKRGARKLLAALPFFLAGAFFSYAFPAVRALVFTYFFFALSLYILETARLNKNNARLWLMVPIMVFWTNLHGGFVAGLGIIFLYAMGQAISGKESWPYVKVLFACTLITLVNPYGFGLWKAIFQHLLQPQPEIREWTNVISAIFLFGPSLDLMVFVFAAGVSLPLSAFMPKRDRTAILVLAITALVGFFHHRHMPFFILSFAAFAPIAIQNIFISVRANPKTWRTPAAGVACILGLALLYFNMQYFYYKIPIAARIGNPLTLNTPGKPYARGAIFYPVDAVNFIENNGFSGNILPYATWGGYISWRLYPESRVAMDLRFETVYPKKIRNEYFDFLRCGPGWQVFLKKYPHDMILVYAGYELHRALKNMAEWHEIYEDNTTVIFSR